MSNTLSDTEKKSLNLLSSKDFSLVVASMDLSPQNHNLLWIAHMATVLSQSQGVKSLKIEASYMTNLMDGSAPRDVPCMNCRIKLSLTNKGYVTNQSYTGGSLTVWHEKDFGFYKASHVNTWIREQIKQFKTLPKNVQCSEHIELIIEKERKKDNSDIIYEKINQSMPEVKSMLINYFLNQQLDDKVEVLRKLKI